MMTYYVETPEMGVSILSDGVGKPFSMRLAAEDDLFLQNSIQIYNSCIFDKVLNLPLNWLPRLTMFHF